MNGDKRYTVKVGITVLVSIIILLYGIAFLKSFKIGLQTNDLVVYFQEVNGLKTGDPVSVNGVTKGKVEDIKLTGDSVRVSFNLSKDVELKKDYVITVAMIELMSGKQILVKPGRDVQAADITKPLIGSRSADVVTLISSMNTISDDIKDFTAKLNHTIDDLNIVIRDINDLTGDERFRSDIKSTASNFNSASKNLDVLLEENRASLKTLTMHLNEIADNVDNTLTDTRPELKQTFSDIKVLTNRLDSLTMNLNEFVSSAKDTSSSVGRFMSSDEFYTNLNKTVLSIDKLVKEIKNKGIKLRIF
jgi:phospholipid/cholesterol/gamma-HCH transport system substrate-binding protein